MNKLIITIAIASLAALSGCAVSTAALEGVGGEPSVNELYVHMPYEHSVATVSGWISRCYPNGVFAEITPMSWKVTHAFPRSPMFAARGNSIKYFIREGDGVTTIELTLHDGQPVFVADMTPEQGGTKVTASAASSDLSLGATNRIQTIITYGNTMGCGS